MTLLSSRTSHQIPTTLSFFSRSLPRSLDEPILQLVLPFLLGLFIVSSQFLLCGMHHVCSSLAPGDVLRLAALLASGLRRRRRRPSLCLLAFATFFACHEYDLRFWSGRLPVINGFQDHQGRIKCAVCGEGMNGC